MEEKNSREKIYATAKEVFYAEGYIKGTIKKIAERAQVPQGLVTYYFKTKDQLVSMILKDFYRSIQNRVDSYSELNITNSLYRQIVVSHIYYEILLSNENNCVFFKELRQKKHSNYEMLREVTDVVYWNYIEDFNFSISKQEFDIFMVMQSAARRDFFINYFEDRWKLSIPDIVNIIEAIVPRLFRIDQNVVDSCLFQGQNIVREINTEGICFLV